MTYRSDEEPAKQRRNNVIYEYQDKGEDALTLLGGHYSKRVALQVFAFMSPCLLWVLPAIYYWGRGIAHNYQENSDLQAGSLLSFIGSLLVLWVAYSGAKLLALLHVKRSLRRYLTPSSDVYRDLDRLRKTPHDFIKERLARLDYAAPLLVLALVIPVIVYVGQYLAGFVPFCPERSQPGLLAISLSFLLSAAGAHLYLVVTMYRLVVRTTREASSEPATNQANEDSLDSYHQLELAKIKVPLLAAVLFFLGYTIPQRLPWYSGLSSSLHDRQDLYGLYMVNCFIFLVFIVLFEQKMSRLLKTQTNPPQE
jgi:hypothetical protein